MSLFEDLKQEFLSQAIEKTASATPEAQFVNPVAREIQEFLKEASEQTQNLKVSDALEILEKQGSSIPSALFNFVHMAETANCTRDEIIEHLGKQAAGELSQIYNGVKGLLGVGTAGVARDFSRGSAITNKAFSNAQNLFDSHLQELGHLTNPTSTPSLGQQVRGLLTGQRAGLARQRALESDMYKIINEMSTKDMDVAADMAKRFNTQIAPRVRTNQDLSNLSTEVLKSVNQARKAAPVAYPETAAGNVAKMWDNLTPIQRQGIMGGAGGLGLGWLMMHDN